jgi:hypothetical protein
MITIVALWALGCAAALVFNYAASKVSGNEKDADNV